MLKPVIFWDWNGTLLDDVDICVDSMNAMLQRRGMKKIDKQLYTEIFSFPVVNYYRTLGFDFTVLSFEDLSVEFIAEYNSRVHLAKLHESVNEILSVFHSQGMQQVIVSAMEQQMLERLLNNHQLLNYFDDILGLKDIFANGKAHLAHTYIDKKKLNPKQITLIGDTLHDAEVANEIGANLILFANGHHSYSRLAQNGHRLIFNLNELPGIFN
jgi:phosphoglycolate phosphatase